MDLAVEIRDLREKLVRAEAEWHSLMTTNGGPPATPPSTLQPSVAERVRRLVGTLKEPQTARELAKAIDARYQTVYAALRHMAQDKQVRRLPKGRWAKV